MGSIISTGGGEAAFRESGLSTSSPHIVPANDQSTLKSSDKEKIEEVLAMLPKTWLDPILAQQSWNLVLKDLSLNNSNKSASSSHSMSTVEGSIVLAMLMMFAQSKPQAIANDAKQKEGIRVQDPLTTTLESFVAHGQGTPLNRDVLTAIQGAPLLLNGLKDVDPKLFTAAYETALQTVVPDMLAGLVHVQHAALGKFGSLKEQHAQNSASMSLVETYLTEAKTNPKGLTQPMLTVALAGVMGGSAVQVPVLLDPKTGASMIDPSKDSVMPAGQTVIADMVGALGPSLRPEVAAALTLNLSQLVSNTQLSSAYWSIPGALSLQDELMQMGGVNERLPSEIEVRTYAMTIAQFILRPQFDALVQGAILKHIPPDKLTEIHLRAFIATLKITMLVNALAAMDKTLMQSVVIRAQDIEGLLSGEIPLEPGDFRSTLVSLIHEQFQILPEKEQVRLKGALRVYFDKNPNVACLIDPVRAFLVLFDPSYLNRANLEQPT